MNCRKRAVQVHRARSVPMACMPAGPWHTGVTLALSSFWLPDWVEDLHQESSLAAIHISPCHPTGFDLTRPATPQTSKLVLPNWSMWWLLAGLVLKCQRCLEHHIGEDLHPNWETTVAQLLSQFCIGSDPGSADAESQPLRSGRCWPLHMLRPPVQEAPLG